MHEMLKIMFDHDHADLVAVWNGQEVARVSADQGGNPDEYAEVARLGCVWLMSQFG